MDEVSASVIVHAGTVQFGPRQIVRAAGAVLAVVAPMCVSHAQSRLPECSLSTGKLWDHCHGTVELGDENYTGEFRDGVRWGYGVLVRRGERYFGEFKNGKPNGRGRLFSGSGELVKEGIWRDGAFSVPMQVPGRPELEIPTELAAAEGETVPLKLTRSGTYSLQIMINGAFTLEATLDSGASSVTVPADVVSTLKRIGALRAGDFKGRGTAVLADGSRSSSERFLIRSLKIGSITAQDVPAAITSQAAGVLVGQSFLGRFDSWTVDNKNRVLILK